ncbi:MAG: hypothetical protein PHV34_22640 [Verrucomicrobiae bacterium]|nr:hypothetical protein [Verrucomicrobiae bacterium]
MEAQLRHASTEESGEFAACAGHLWPSVIGDPGKTPAFDDQRFEGAMMTPAFLERRFFDSSLCHRHLDAVLYPVVAFDGAF